MKLLFLIGFYTAFLELGISQESLLSISTQNNSAFNDTFVVMKSFGDYEKINNGNSTAIVDTFYVHKNKLLTYLQRFSSDRQIYRINFTTIGQPINTSSANYGSKNGSIWIVLNNKSYLKLCLDLSNVLQNAEIVEGDSTNIAILKAYKIFKDVEMFENRIIERMDILKKKGDFERDSLWKMRDSIPYFMKVVQKKVFEYQIYEKDDWAVLTIAYLAGYPNVEDSIIEEYSKILGNRFSKNSEIKSYAKSYNKKLNELMAEKSSRK